MSTTPHRLGKYELQHHLGRGRVGDVWKARDLSLQRDVAVKILYPDLQQSDPHFLTRLMTEGQGMIALHHANIVQVHEVNVARSEQSRETVAYVSMDYIEGATLADYVSSSSHRGMFPPISEIVYLFTSLGVAIDYAHQQGIVHGNITPSNVLLNKHDTSHFAAGEPLLADCGLNQLVGNSGTTGTPHYISPEQARGNPANNRSDIYALGVMLYELCTGIVPFRDESSVAVMMQHINTLPTPPILINPNIPPALSEVILRAMGKDPAMRFAMASLFAAAIADACSLQRSISLGDQLPRIAAEAEDEAYTSQSQPSMPSILGVSQPQLRPSTGHQFVARTQMGPSARPPSIAQQSPSPAPPVSQPLAALERTTSKPLAAAPVTQPDTTEQSTQRMPSQPQTQSTPTIKNPIYNHVEKPSMPEVLAAQRSIPLTQTPARVPVPYTPPTPPITKSSVPIPRVPPEMTTRSRLKHMDMTVYILVASLVLVAIIILGVFAANAFFNRGPSVAMAPGRVFVQDDALGHNDQLRITMQNIPNPPAGKSYFAWLEDTNQHFRQLGALTTTNGQLALIYGGDAQHTNLISIMQGIVITTEQAGTTPQTPSANRVYQASFSNAVLPYLKNILYQTPNLPGNQEALSVMLDNIQSINDKAGSIVDTLNVDNGLMLRQATRIVEILDGTAYAGTSGDRPPSQTPQLNIPVGLLSTPTQQGYIDVVSSQLTQLKQAAGNDQALIQHIQNTQNALTDVKTWLQNLRTYDVKLLKAADLHTPAVMDVALQIKQAAADSYNGRVIPPNQTPLLTLGSAGMIQAYSEAQSLASLNLQAV